MFAFVPVQAEVFFGQTLPPVHIYLADAYAASPQQKPSVQSIQRSTLPRFLAGEPYDVLNCPASQVCGIWPFRQKKPCGHTAISVTIPLHRISLPAPKASEPFVAPIEASAQFVPDGYTKSHLKRALS